MCCAKLWKRVIPFFAALAIAVGAVNLARQFDTSSSAVPQRGDGSGWGSGSGRHLTTRHEEPVASDKLSIRSKPRPGYTDEARMASVEGRVLLRVTFDASGEIGAVQVIEGLSHGLTEQAVAAAKQIKFQPKKVNGTPVSSIRNVEYSFTIY
jgi:TonB family protein